ncbi:hypothetical protein GJ496_002075 [Pomphorhynchus laevis]|nr:hypothetical protein GJ496_002075 [Pomphorhynchus laevis]
MMSEAVSASDDILVRLQNIHGMFDSSKSTENEKPTLTRQEKFDPAESLLEKLRMYEKCDGSVEEQQIEKQRKEYFEGLQFNTLKTALHLFKNSAEQRQAKEAEIRANTLVPTNLVSKGTIDDIRSVFVNAITAINDNEIPLESISDEQWLSSSNEDRIRKLLTLSLPYLRSYEEMTDDLVLDSVRKAFLNVSREVCNKNALSAKEQNIEINDRQWFCGITDERVEKIIDIATESSRIDNSNQNLNDDMWCKIRAALLHCVTSTAGLFNKQSKVKSETVLDSNSQRESNLTASRIEKILAESSKEFRNANKQLDLKIVEGITNELKNRIQTAILDQQKGSTRDDERRFSHFEDASGLSNDSAVPAKLTADRLNKIFSDFKKQTKKSVNIDPAQFEGLASSIKEKILEEMNKEPSTGNRTVIDVQSGLANSAKQKFLDDMSGKQKIQSKDINDPQTTPKAIDQEKLDRFTKLVDESQPTEWVPDVDLQSGLAKERKDAFSSSAVTKQRSVEWTPDVPITSGMARERASLLYDNTTASTNTAAWTPDVHLETGLAKDRAAQLLAAATKYSNYSGKQWEPDVILESGNVGQRVESFVKDVASASAFNEHEWIPDIELPAGFTKQRMQHLFEGKTSLEELDAKDANELIRAGVTKERLSEFLSMRDAKANKESWEPDIELQKGLTKERTSLFHNLENLQQIKQHISSAQDELNQLNQPNIKRVVVEVENEPIPSDPSIARGDSGTEQAQVEVGHTKSIIERLKNAYDADAEPATSDNENIKQEISLSEGHAQVLRRKFTDFENDAKTIHTTTEKQTALPRRFVSKPAPVPIQYETVTAEKCLCCHGPVCSTEGVQIQQKGFVHKKCMKCPTCNKIPPSAEAVYRNNHIYCIEHEDK